MHREVPTPVARGDYRNYHLHLEYKWADKRWTQNPEFPRNNGILYHSCGDFGAVDHTWMKGLELEMIPGQIAGAPPVMALHDLTAGKGCAPLTHGRIQIPSEGAETFFRTSRSSRSTGCP